MIYMRKLCFLCLVLAVFSLTACVSNSVVDIPFPYTQEYVAGKGNIKGSVDIDAYNKIDERFAIGANKDGYAVFKDPDAAYEALLEKYSDGINLIQREFDLDDLSKDNYSEYKIYGWQVLTGTEEEIAQSEFISRFFDIYENSYLKS